MSGSHTPGPWEARKPSNVHTTLVSGNPAGHEGRNGGIYVARVQGPDNIANARLIAAAPELLEALKAARSALASLDEFSLGGVDVPDTATGECVGQYGIRDELLSKIDAAIARASVQS